MPAHSYILEFNTVVYARVRGRSNNRLMVDIVIPMCGIRH